MKEKVNKIVCDECEKEFLLKSVDINKEKIKLNGVIVDLVYFVCPSCSKIYKISIQDALYYDLQKDLEKAKKRVRKNHGSNDIEMARVLNKMVLLKLERLRKHVDLVNKMFPGTFTFEVSENNPKDKKIKYLP